MERGRTKQSVRFLPYEEGGFSPIFVTATVSVVALVAVFGWEMIHPSNPSYKPMPSTDTKTALPSAAISTPATNSYALEAAPSTSESPSDLTEVGNVVLGNLVNAYTSLQSSGLYSSSTATAAANDIIPSAQPTITYRTYAPSELKTDADISYERMLTYRSDLRMTLAPLLNNSTEPEYEIFAAYATTGSESYRTQLNEIIQNYHAAADATAKVVVPRDAVSYHVGILNAMQEFAATLATMERYAKDPFAVALLLRAYNQAESDMLTSFDALTTYYHSKTQ